MKETLIDPFWKAIVQGIYEHLKNKGYLVTLHSCWFGPNEDLSQKHNFSGTCASDSDILVRHNTIRRFGRIILTASRVDVTIVTYEGDHRYAFQYEDPEMLDQIEKCLESHDLRPPPECRQINPVPCSVTENSNDRTTISHSTPPRNCRAKRTSENFDRTSRRT